MEEAWWWSKQGEKKEEKLTVFICHCYVHKEKYGDSNNLDVLYCVLQLVPKHVVREVQILLFTSEKRKRLGEPCSQPIFTSLRAGPAGQNVLSCNNEVSIHGHKIFKNGRNIKLFSFSERYTSKLSVGWFWALWDH